MLSSPYGLGGRGGGLRPDPPLGGCWGGAFFSGVPQLLGGFGGADSTSSVSVPQTGMGGGVPPPSWNTLSGISVMFTGSWGVHLGVDIGKLALFYLLQV